ncbi:hypothetical protein NYE80_18745 [Paenibacillus sp. FSL H7-0357]|uniref:hypothetical protein n=1 Tax=Paenibacillus sp. FSL H7-0357 TaxID=1536774 RepID=UPI0030CC67FE
MEIWQKNKEPSFDLSPSWFVYNSKIIIFWGDEKYSLQVDTRKKPNVITRNEYTWRGSFYGQKRTSISTVYGRFQDGGGQGVS